MEEFTTWPSFSLSMKLHMETDIMQMQALIQWSYRFKCLYPGRWEYSAKKTDKSLKSKAVFIPPKMQKGNGLILGFF